MEPIILDLTKGITETEQYKAWKFPGGEIHFKLKPEFAQLLTNSPARSLLYVNSRMNTSDKFLFTCLVLDQLHKDYDNEISLFVGYFPYQQADRDFGEDEPFALESIIKLLGTSNVSEVAVFDPHSDVLPALLKAHVCRNVTVIDNSDFIKEVISSIHQYNEALTDGEGMWSVKEDLVILSPDAGAYKKIFKLAEKIGFEGSIETANKYRRHGDNEILTRVSTDDFGGRDVLIIDDICMGGATFIQLAKEVQKRNVGNLYLAVSHGVFNNGFNELEKYFTRIYTTKSYRRSYDGASKLEVFEI